MTPEMFRKLAALGLSHEQMAGVLEVFDEHAQQLDGAEEERKAKGRERWRRWDCKRKANVSQHEQTLANSSRASVARGLDNLQTKKISGEEKKEERSAAAPRGDLADFRSELSSILDPERIEALVAVRRKKGATMTANTGRLLVAAIQRCNVPPAEVADEMALRNWTSVKPDWLESKSSPAQRSTSPPRERSVSDVLREMASGTYSGPPDHEPAYPTIEASFSRRN